MPPTTRVAALAALATSLYMLGVIGFVRAVHYPLFDRVEPGRFAEFHAQHTRRTGYVVMLPMVVELASAAWLGWAGVDGVERGWTRAGFVAAMATWGVTFFFSVPAHGRLARGFDLDAHRTLLVADYARIVAWSAHASIMLVVANRLIR